MEKHNIVLIGLGRIGTIFLKQALDKPDVLNVCAVCEIHETEGRRLAVEKGIPVLELNEIIALGVDIDVIFDLTGDKNISKTMCKKLCESGNTYTQVAQNRLARLVWDLISEDIYLPDLGKGKPQAYADMLLFGKN